MPHCGVQVCVGSGECWGTWLGQSHSVPRRDAHPRESRGGWDNTDQMGSGGTQEEGRDPALPLSFATRGRAQVPQPPFPRLQTMRADSFSCGFGI